MLSQQKSRFSDGNQIQSCVSAAVFQEQINHLISLGATQAKKRRAATPMARRSALIGSRRLQISKQSHKIPSQAWDLAARV